MGGQVWGRKRGEQDTWGLAKREGRGRSVCRMKDLWPLHGKVEERKAVRKSTRHAKRDKKLLAPTTLDHQPPTTNHVRQSFFPPTRPYRP